MFKEILLPSHASNPETNLMLIYTGGTLGMVMDEGEKTLRPIDFEEILEHIPELKKFNSNITIYSFDKPIDSSDMTPELWTQMGDLIFKNYSDFDGFVIIHGTDTLAYTASALSFMFENLGKPIIITGSQMPLGLRRSDARNNLITSLEIASLKNNDKSRIREVCVFFDYQLMRGNRAKKIESDQFHAFHSENYPVLAEVGIDIEVNDHYLWQTFNDGHFSFKNQFSSKVFNWKIFPGMTLSGISDIFIHAGFKGIIIETYGSGNAPTSEGFLREIRNLVDNNVFVLNVSQCLGGSVRQGRYSTSKKLDEFGVISGKDITSEAAIVKMKYLLGNFKDVIEIRNNLSKSIRGEMND